MKITEAELIHLLNICRDTWSIANYNFGGLSVEQRQELYNQIINRGTKEVEIDET